MSITLPAVLSVSAFASLAMLAFRAAVAAASDAPATYLLDGRALLETRRRALARDPAVAEGLKELRRRADKCMQGELWTVMSKPAAGPSGDKHDYLSLAPYFWPNPATADGLPYILRDGQYNPETRQYDRTRLDGMCDMVCTLALAHYLTGEAPTGAYGQRAVEQLRAWFLDETTRMNPHLRNTQFVRGKNDGNPWGLIETERLMDVVDGVALLRATGIRSAEDDKRLKHWFADYLTWLQTSDLGKREDGAPNNHGFFYDLQTADFALFIGRDDLAKQILESAKSRRIATQIEPDGSQPQELARTISFHYSLLNLWGMTRLARLGEHAGVDLWNYRTTDGRGIRGALDWLLPYALGKPWEHKQITRPDYSPMVWVLREAARAYNDPSYEQAIAKLPGVEREIVWLNLLNPPTTQAKPAEQAMFDQLNAGPWKQVFDDPCTGDWHERWTLDGLKAKVVNAPHGMDFSAGPVVGEDASHAVLWTKQSFTGDLKIEYEYTRLDEQTRPTSTMLYIEATGTGEGPYAKDIATWAKLRTVPTMTLYHSGMHLLHISCAAMGRNNEGPTDNYCRARWYGKGLDDSVFAPDYPHAGLFATGVPHQITVIKKGHDLFMRVKGPNKELLCHWDISSKPPVTEGYIGLRHMFTRAVRYRDFRVSAWDSASSARTP